MPKPTKTTDYAKRSRNPSLEQAAESSKPQKKQKLRANAASGSSQVPDSASFGDATEASKSQETAVPIPTNASSPKVPCPLDNCDRLYTPSANARADHIKRWHRLRTCDICSFSAPVGDSGLGHHKTEAHTLVSCQCGEECAGTEELARHDQREHPERSPFDCRRKGCDKKYKSRKRIWSHNREVHVSVPCPRCGAKVDGEANLDTHKRSVHGDFGRFDCRREGCGAQHGYASLLSHHNQEVHDSVPCPCCGEVVVGGANLDIHKRSVHGDFGRFDCRREGCGAQYTSASRLSCHNQDLHDSVPCPRCGEVVVGGANLDIHKRSVHGDFGRFDCRREGCGAQYTSASRLSCHNQDMHRSVPCPRCGQQLVGEANLDAHKRSVHSDFGRFDCRREGCGVQYACASALSIHEEYHAGTRTLDRPPQRIPSAPALVPRVRSAISDPERPTRSYSDAARSAARSSAATASSIRRPIPFNTSTPTHAQIPPTSLLACTIRWVLEQRDIYDAYVEYQACSSTPVPATTPVSSYMRIQEKIRQAVLTCTSDIRWEAVNNAPIVASMYPGLDRKFSALNAVITSTAPDDMGKPSSSAADSASVAGPPSDIEAGVKFHHAWSDLGKQYDFSRIFVDALDTFPELFQPSANGRPGLLDLIEVHQHMTETIASDDLRLSTPYAVANYHNGLILLFRIALKDGEKLFPIGSLPDGRRIYIILFNQLYRLVAQGITWHFPGVFLLLGDCVLDDFEAAWLSWRPGQDPALISARKAFLDLLRGLFHATISQGWVAHHRSELRGVSPTAAGQLDWWQYVLEVYPACTNKKKFCDGRVFHQPTHGFTKMSKHDRLSVRTRVGRAPPPVPGCDDLNTAMDSLRRAGEHTVYPCPWNLCHFGPHAVLRDLFVAEACLKHWICKWKDGHAR